MANITISIDDDLLKRARKIAIDRDTSFNGLVREYVESLVTSFMNGSAPCQQLSSESAAAQRVRAGQSPLRLGFLCSVRHHHTQ